MDKNELNLYMRSYLISVLKIFILAIYHCQMQDEK